MISNNFAEGFNCLVDTAGTICGFRYYIRTIGSVWDDQESLSEVTGSNFWQSGIVLPINSLNGTQDQVLQQQGLLVDGDLKLFISGGIGLRDTTTGSDFEVKIQVGSPNGLQHQIIPDGVTAPEVNSSTIYKKVFIRRLTNGSFIGE